MSLPPEDPPPGVVYVRRDALRHMARTLAADGFVYLHCADWECGQFTVLPAGQAWVCPVHGVEGVEP